jgi:hypothetical protein
MHGALAAMVAGALASASTPAAAETAPYASPASVPEKSANDNGMY